MKSYSQILGLLCATLLVAGQAAFADVRPFAYVSNQEAGVTVIDIDTSSIVGQIDVKGKTPRGIAITDDGKFLLTANRDSNDVSVIDLATQKFLRSVFVGNKPGFLRIHGGHAYVTFEISDKFGSGVAVIDLKNWKVVRTIQTGQESEGIEFSKDGKYMLVANEKDNAVKVFTLPDGKVFRTIDTSKTGLQPRGIKRTLDGKYYFVSLELSDKILVLDAAFKVVRAINTASKPYGVAFDSKGKYFLVAAFGAKLLQVFDLKTYRLLKEIKIGDRCWHFTFTPDEKTILIACGRSNEVLIIDPIGEALVKHLPGFKTPWGAISWPKAMGSLDSL